MSDLIVNDIVSLVQAGPIMDTELKAKFRNKLDELEEAMRELPQVETSLRHFFGSGVYGREIFMEKGSLILGKIHKGKTINFIMKGKVSVASIDGIQHLEAPAVFVSSPGAKRLVFIHEDCTWATAHANPSDTTDLSELEEFVIAKNYGEVPGIDPEELKLIEGAKK
jgi:hypothetical protein